MPKQILVRSVYILLLVVLVVGILYLAKPLFMPLAIAALLAFVFLPCCKWLETKGCNRIVASIICGLLLAAAIGGILVVLTWRIRHLAGDLSQIRERFSGFIYHFRHYLHDSVGIEPPKQKDLLAATVSPDAAGISHTMTLLMTMLIGLVINLILILVYMIMLLCLRPRFKEFILRLVPSDTQSKTKMILIRSVRLVQQYLSGLAIIIGCLWVMYAIGFSIVGIRNAIFFAILCGILEIVPFVGNLTGSTITSLVALSQGGGMPMVLGVLGTYALIQFLQFYIISPMVMRTQVNINPLFTILVLIAGDLVWGISGMILAIPLLGIIKIVFDNIGELQPLGDLIGREKPPGRISLLQKAKRRKLPEGQ